MSLLVPGLRRLGLVAVAAVIAGLVVLTPATAGAAAAEPPALVRVPADSPTIQQAVDAVAPGGTVLVSPGTYAESIRVRDKDVRLRSAAGPAATIIETGGGDDTSVWFVRTTRASTVEGFTIRGIGGEVGDGSGVVVAFGAATVVGNVIEGHPGIGVGVGESSALVRGNVIRGNGGGLRLAWASGAEIAGNLVEDNTALSGGGIELFSGGAPAITGNVFRRNRATFDGGAIYAVNYSTPYIAQNLFIDNRAEYGGAVALESPYAWFGGWLVNNTMAGNRATRGAAFYGYGDSLSRNNVMLNGPGDASAVAWCDGFVPRLAYNDLYNGTEHVVTGCADVDNLSVPPALRPDGSLAAGSPLIDAGAVADPLEPLLPDFDGAGSARITDGNGDGVARVDLGAFEFPGRGFAPEAILAAPAGGAGLAFGTVPVGGSATRTVTVSNAGLGDLRVTATSLTGNTPGLSAAPGTCAAAAVSMLATCDVAVTFAPGSSGARSATLAIATTGGTLTVPLTASGGVEATPSSPSAAWSVPAPAALDGVGTWLFTANDPVAAAGPGDLAPSVLYAHLLTFAGAPQASAAVSLGVQPAGRFALFSARAPDGTPSAVAVPFEWRANRFYFTFLYRVSPAEWGAWVYDHSAGAWATVGTLPLPAAWGGLAPASTTAVQWFGATAATCAAYPLADVLFHPPVGFAGPSAALATAAGTSTGSGTCPATVAVEGAWTRLRAGSP